MNRPAARDVGEIGPDGAARLWHEDPAGSRQPVPHIVRRSPAGVAWGYDGSGPADAGLSILTHAAGSRAAVEPLHDQFCREQIVTADRDRLDLAATTVAAWLDCRGVPPSGLYPRAPHVRPHGTGACVSVNGRDVFRVDVVGWAPRQWGQRFVELGDATTGQRFGLFDPRRGLGAPRVDVQPGGYDGDRQRWTVTVDGTALAQLGVPPLRGAAALEVAVSPPPAWPMVRAPTAVRERMLQRRVGPAAESLGL